MQQEDTFTKRENTVSATESDYDQNVITTIRPQEIDSFIGQEKLKRNLIVFISSAKSRQEPLDHILFHGPPGLGKTTLSQIISKEMGVDFKMTSGPMITKTGDLAAILTNLREGDVFFIDEIHRLSATVEEVLYSAMEDYFIDVIIGEGPSARTMKITLPRFTLVGATTKLGSLSSPLRDRFSIPIKLDFYSEAELVQVIQRTANILKILISHDACTSIAKSARGTPRIAIRLLKRVRDFSLFFKESQVSLQTTTKALASLGVDDMGLDNSDYDYLNYIFENYEGGPVGVETIAAGISEDKDTIEDTIEPYLMKIGFVSRTPRGRMLTQGAISYIKGLSVIKNHSIDS